MSRKHLTIGLFGFGTVGKGLFDALQITRDLRIDIKKIVVKSKNKPRALPEAFFSYDKWDILNDPDINVVVELIDDADAAFEIVSAALGSGKAVVTANKKLVAEHLDELIELQNQHNVPLLYEAACCASLPIIRNLEEYYDNDLLRSVQGIVNGSTNYILSRIFDQGWAYQEALRVAQEKGFAESDPRLDVEGFDAKYKLILLLLHAFGTKARPDDIWNLGIQRIGDLDARYAREKGLRIKLVAQARKLNDHLVSFVAPQFVSAQSKLYFTNDEYNGVLVESFFADKQFIEGKGAGAFPTASAVLSDLSALTYDYRYEYKKIRTGSSLKLTSAVPIRVFVSYPAGTYPAADFDQIQEQYIRQGEQYIIGIIQLDRLINAPWLHQVSVILTEDALDHLADPFAPAS
jgi:homoserine dehydrogenase